MPLHKVTDFLSEISSFFRKNDAHKAMYSILDVIKWLKMNESTLFGMKSKCNNVYPLLQVFQALLLFPCFMVRNPYRFTGSSLSGLLGCQKDVFYRFMSNPKINWRKSVYHLTLQLWSKIRLRSGRKEGTVCLIVDDTDYPKTGRRMGKDGKFGMSDEELARRFTKGRDSGDALQERIGEYTAKKTDLMIAMIRRAIRKGVRFRYVLADSWFACKDVIRFIRSRHVRCDYLGMIKVGENSRTKYCLDGKPYTAPALIRHLDRQGRRKYSRRLRCYYIVADVTFADTKVRLYFVRRSKRGAWNGLMTTDIRLEFLEAYRIYAQRWSLEVVFKEAKGLLGLGKCQAGNFASQIAATSLTALQYNILSLVKRFAAERIWGVMQELVIAVAELFGLTDEDIY